MNRFNVNARSVKIKEKKRVREVFLHRDRFDPLDFFVGERELWPGDLLSYVVGLWFRSTAACRLAGQSER